MRTRPPPASPAAPETTTRADGVLRFERLPAGLGIRLRGIGWSALQPGKWQWRLSKPYWVLYRNDRDGAEVDLGGSAIPLRAGRGYLIPPRQTYRTSCAASLRHLFVYLDLSGLSPHSAAALHGRILEVPPAIDLAWLDAIAARAGRKLGDAEQLRLHGVVLGTLQESLPDGPPAAWTRRWRRRCPGSCAISPSRSRSPSSPRAADCARTPSPPASAPPTALPRFSTCAACAPNARRPCSPPPR